MFNFDKDKKSENSGVVILFDIGGTKMRVSLSRDGKTISKTEKLPTPKNFTEGMQFLEKLVGDVSGGEPVVAISGGLAGILAPDGDQIFRLPNLPEWDGKFIKTEISRHFGVPVYLENDCAMAGLGEAAYGAGRGSSVVVYMSVSTGIGGARIVDGKIDEKVFGFEPGHQIIGAGDLESLISGSAVEKKYGMHPADINDPEILRELAANLAVGIYNSVLYWSPEAVVLGGSMITGKNPISLEEVRKKFSELPVFFPEAPDIVKAELGDDGAMYGALEYAKQKIS